MILFDTETTGLVEHNSRPLSEQPEIIEFAAMKLDISTLNEMGYLEFMCRPSKPIPVETTKIHGITNEKVAGKKPFVAHYNDLCNFFLGETTLVAHFIGFDIDMLKFELMRIGKVLNFPWPMTHICTKEVSEHITGMPLRLRQLHKMATGKEHEGEHRAMADVKALATCVRYLRHEHGLI